MNFYKHYIGDFQRDTGHLSLTERGAYLCLIHHYYATEKPLPNDHAALCRIAGAMDKAERDAVRAAMSFFDAVESGLMHKRIEAEIEKNGRIADTNRDIAVAREAKRRAERESRTEHEPSTKRAQGVPRTLHEQSTHQTPDTRHQTEPSVLKKTARGRAPPAVEVAELIAAGFEPAVATEFIAHKAAVKAPLTARAWADHLSESAKAGWTPQQAAEKVMAKAWKGFEAKYVAAERGAGGAQAPTFRERDEQRAIARVHEMTGGLVSAKPTAPRRDALQEVFDAPRALG